MVLYKCECGYETKIQVRNDVTLKQNKTMYIWEKYGVC